MKNFNVTCHVEGCVNDNIVITIPSEDTNPIVFCGPCGNLITDVVLVK
jgi:hypothetical protein